MSRVRQGDRDRARVIAAVVRQRAQAAGVALDRGLRLWTLAAMEDRATASRAGGSGNGEGSAREPAESATAVLDPVEADLAEVLEGATSASARRANGLHVTPRWLAEHVMALALDGVSHSAPTVCDPACGGGAFLLAAARALHAQGVSRSDVVRRLVWGADVDPVGLATAEAALALWAGEAPAPGRLVLGDALAAGPRVWPTRPPQGFDLVVGNPPFLNQLERATVRSARVNERLKARYGSAVRAYTDAAWLFLLLGVELARSGGRVALLQPLSLVGARDAAAVRDALDTRATLRSLWVEQRRSFAASVQVCAPVLEVTDPARTSGSGQSAVETGAADSPGARGVDVRGAEVTTVQAIKSADRRSDRSAVETGAADPLGARGADVHNREVTTGQAIESAAAAVESRAAANDWADRVADALGVPRVPAVGGGRLGDRAQVVAGFRDEYYGLVPLVTEHSGPDDERPLVTAGALDWGGSAWGLRPTRFAKRSWLAPVVDLSRRDPTDDSPAARGGSRWIERVSRSKVVVATQTPVVEAAVDETGRWVPCVPTLAVLPHSLDSDELWLLAAALSAPSSTAWLLRRAPGTALSRNALKIAARDLAALPLPVDDGAWTEAAMALRSYAQRPGPTEFEAFVAAAAVAYRAGSDLVLWWRSRFAGPTSARADVRPYATESPSGHAVSTAGITPTGPGTDHGPTAPGSRSGDPVPAAGITATGPGTDDGPTAAVEAGKPSSDAGRALG